MAFEAASYAGHDGLDNLIVIYDSNDVTLDKMADFTQSEDHAARFAAIGCDTCLAWLCGCVWQWGCFVGGNVSRLQDAVSLYCTRTSPHACPSPRPHSFDLLPAGTR